MPTLSSASPKLAAARRTARREVTITELLRWTYAEQHAARTLRRPLDWFLWGAGRDGLLSNPRDLRPLHADAVLVHQAVLLLDPSRLGRNGVIALGPDAALVIGCALADDWPAPIDGWDAIPRPVPIEPPTREDDYGWHIGADGERRHHWIRTSEILSYDEEEWVISGRKRMRRGRSRRVRFEVKYCPIAWDPDPDRIAAHNASAAHVALLLGRLERELAGARLQRHALVPLAAARC